MIKIFPFICMRSKCLADKYQLRSRELKQNAIIIAQGALYAARRNHWRPVKAISANNLTKTLFQITINITTMKEMQALNCKYKTNKLVPTDILSFPCQFDNEFCKRSFKSIRDSHLQNPCALGDIYICPAWIKRKYSMLILNSTVQFKRILFNLIIHGTTHLLGLDHHSTAKEADMMRNVEKETIAYYFSKSNIFKKNDK